MSQPAPPPADVEWTQHWRRLERMVCSAPCHQQHPPVVTVERGRATMRLEAHPDLFHSAGSLHGSIFFKAMDDAAGLAVNSLSLDFAWFTSAMQIEFLRPVTTGFVEATATVIHQSKSRALADAVLVDAAGTEVGRGRATFMPSRVPVGKAAGYLEPAPGQ